MFAKLLLTSSDDTGNMLFQTIIHFKRKMFVKYLKNSISQISEILNEMTRQEKMLFICYSEWINYMSLHWVSLSLFQTLPNLAFKTLMCYIVYCLAFSIKSEEKNMKVCCFDFVSKLNTINLKKIIDIISFLCFLKLIATFFLKFSTLIQLNKQKKIT